MGVHGTSLDVRAVTARPTRDELIAAGRAARDRLPASALAGWRPAADRGEPVQLLVGQATTRAAELVPVRYGRMAVSPFTFYRGAALPMAADLAPGPTSGILVQLCGDAHLSNFGLYATPERAEVFDINDFDETLEGPFEWDLERLAASLIVAARSRGFAASDGRHAVHRAIRSYRERMAGYAEGRAIEVYYASVAVSTILTYVDKRARPMIEAAVRLGLPSRFDPRAAQAHRARRWQPAHRRSPTGDPPSRRRHEPAREHGAGRLIAIRSRTTAGCCSTGTRWSTTR